MDKVEVLIIILTILIAIAIVVGLYTYSINTFGFEEFIERLKRLEKWMW